MEDVRTALNDLKQSRILKSISEDMLKKIIPLCRRESFTAGDVILREKADNYKVYILMTGSVSIYANGEFIVQLKRKGDIFGEMSVITGEAVTASVIADTNVDVLGIKSKDIGAYDLHRVETLENIFFRLFSKILSEKLAITTQKARQHEIANRELIQIQKKLEEATNEAISAAKAKSVFLALMSHEIRTPLNSIIGNTELMFYTDLSEEQEKHINTIYRSGETLLTTVNNILDFTAVEAGELILERKPFKIRKLFEDLAEMFEFEINNKGIEFSIEIDPSVADSYVGDKNRIQQVFINLIGNAVKFTNSGFVRLTLIEKNAESDSKTVEFKLADSGIGIPEDKLKDIFDMFSQVDLSNTRKYGGSGLGLALCKSILELMGGEISVKSRVDQGTTFTLSVPFSVNEENY